MAVSKIERNINMFLVGILLVAFPIASYYYMSAGYNYIKKAYSELGDHGQVPDFSFITQEGDTLTQEDIKGKIVVSNFTYTNCGEDCQAMNDQMKRVRDAFQDTDEVIFISHTLDTKNDGVQELDTYAKKYEAEVGKWYFVKAATGDMKSHAEQHQVTTSGLDIPSGAIGSTQVVLIDTASTIRNFYDAKDKAAIDRMVVHISMMVPKPKEADIEFERAKEM